VFFLIIKQVEGGLLGSLFLAKQELVKPISWGVVIHACNPSTQRLGQEDCELKASLGDIVKPHVIKK
jgi:hypothetical protein